MRAHLESHWRWQGRDIWSFAIPLFRARDSKVEEKKYYAPGAAFLGNLAKD
jgi:hypothetical protein